MAFLSWLLYFRVNKAKEDLLLNEWLLNFAWWLDSFAWSTSLHESFYMYAWVESTHVLTIMVFLGMLFVIDLRMLGLAFVNVPASKISERLDKPMMIGFTLMIITGFILFFAIPVRSTQSIWFRIKVVLLIAAGINAFLFRSKMRNAKGSWDLDRKPPKRIRVGAGLSLALWAGVVATGRTIAYDWFDCHKELSYFMYWAAGCVDEMALMD
jgi:uncharacterized membrane protein